MTGTFPENECPICLQPRCRWGPYTDGRDAYWIDCEICGRLNLAGTAHSTLEHECRTYENGRERLRFAVRRLTSDRSEPTIGSDDIERMIENTSLPHPIEQSENLIYWLGKSTKGLGDFQHLDIEKIMSIIGGWHQANVDKLIDELLRKKQIVKESFKDGHRISLTFDGWEHFSEIQKGQVVSKVAIMAMPFDDTLLNDMFLNTFKPAAKDAGFELKRIDEDAPAGLIDSRMRNEIRNSRFVVAELTGDNSGAYFEAGLAEGFGKPVIYTCRRSYFEDNKTHFDANHYHTIKWDENDRDKAYNDLCSTIRSTLPNESTPEGE